MNSWGLSKNGWEIVTCIVVLLVIIYILKSGYDWSKSAKKQTFVRGSTTKTTFHTQAVKSKNFSTNELNKIINPFHINGWGTVADAMVRLGHRFEVYQITALLDSPQGKKNVLIPLSMAQNGHKFSFNEIIRLGNPADWMGATLAHWGARLGQCFSVEQLVQLGECIICKDEKSKLATYDRYKASQFYRDENYEIGSELTFDGASVAHIMARKGYRFSDEEIKVLGYPKDAGGLTLTDWMEYATNPRIENVLAKYFANGLPKIIPFNLRAYYESRPANLSKCYYCSSRIDNFDTSKSLAADDDLTNFCIIPSYGFTKLFYCKNCGWWCIREVWDDCEYNGTRDFLIVGLERDKTLFYSSNINAKDAPWRMALADLHIYDDLYPFPDELAPYFPGEERIYKQ